MSWTAPMTAVANATFSAAEFNTYVRDNLNETAPALASTAGSIFVTDDTNSIVERAVKTAEVTTSEQTTSTTFDDLDTSGPAVTVTTGEQALVFTGCQALSSSSTGQCVASHAVSGSTTLAGNDKWGTVHVGSTSTRIGAAYLHTGLTAGSNTFTMKYRVGSGTGTFSNRSIVVVAL